MLTMEACDAAAPRSKCTADSSIAKGSPGLAIARVDIIRVCKRRLDDRAAREEGISRFDSRDAVFTQDRGTQNSQRLQLGRTSRDRDPARVGLNFKLTRFEECSVLVGQGAHEKWGRRLTDFAEVCKRSVYVAESRNNSFNPRCCELRLLSQELNAD